MEHISKMDNRPDVLVYFTDGWCDFGPPPDFDVIWVINTEVVAPYGTTIHVKGR
jgi:predicted metal-dependent peptidase